MTREERTETRNIFYFHVSATHFFKDEEGNRKTEKSTIDSGLKKIMQLDFSDDEQKTAVFKYGSSFIAMKIDTEGDNYFAGQIANVREKAFPKGLRDGKLVSIDFKGTKLYEPAHFIYLKDSKILVMEYNHFAPRHAAFAWYVQKISKKYGLNATKVDISYETGRETLDRFMRADGHAKSIKIAVPVHSYNTTPQGSLMEMLDGALESADEERMASIIIEVKFAPVRDAGGQTHSERERELELQNRRDIAELWNGAGVEFQDFRVDMEGHQPFDFITDKVKESITVRMTDLGHVDTESIHQELRAAYTARYSEH